MTDQYDLLIFLGDLAYEMTDDNCYNGDRYFDQMETLLTRTPYIITPGNHEDIDYF